MTTQNQQPADNTVTRADHDAAITAARTAAHAEGHAAGRTEGEAAGRTAAVDRVRAILTAPEAKGREPQALVFALDSDMTPEVAAKALAASPAVNARPPLAARGSDPLPGGATDTKVDGKPAWDRSLKRAGAKLPA